MSAALANRSHAPDKGEKNIPLPRIYKTILVAEGQRIWSPMAGF